MDKKNKSNVMIVAIVAIVAIAILVNNRNNTVGTPYTYDPYDLGDTSCDDCKNCYDANMRCYRAMQRGDYESPHCNEARECSHLYGEDCRGMRDRGECSWGGTYQGRGDMGGSLGVWE